MLHDRKYHQIARPTFLLVVTCITALVLFLGSETLHISGLSPLSFAHATQTCVSSKGTQEALCEQQDPVVQGCEQDAHSIEVIYVFSESNILTGEVDLRHSNLCKTLWVRSILFQTGWQVQSIDAVISFRDGNKQDVKVVRGKTIEKLIAITHMSFFQPAIMATNWAGMFYVNGQTKPMVIPLLNTVPYVADP